MVLSRCCTRIQYYLAETLPKFRGQSNPYQLMIRSPQAAGPCFEGVPISAYAVCGDYLQAVGERQSHLAKKSCEAATEQHTKVYNNIG